MDAPGSSSSVKAKFLLDGAYLGADSSAPFEYPLVAGPGQHRLKVRLSDAAANETTLEAAFAVSTSAGAPVPSATTTPPVPTPSPTATTVPVPSAGRVVVVRTGAELTAALAAAAPGTVLDGVEVKNIGAEGMHLRSFSSDDVVRNSVVHDTGKSPQYGEGIYVGSAVSNWGTYSGGKRDTSDRNVVTSNSIWATGAESVDIKEGTTGGTLSNNRFDGVGMAGRNSADSWVDVKGNGWLVAGNTGSHALLDGFQTHVLAPG